jgi:hypothetical protein
MACTADEPGLPPQDNHLEWVGRAIRNIKNENTSVGGALGSRFSTRRKLYDLLQHYHERPIDLFYTQERKDELKFAIDQIYNFPMLESARFVLSRMMRTSTHDELVETVLEMYEHGNLCRIDEDINKHKEPTIICSMGLKA